jgi:hypothetical protein
VWKRIAGSRKFQKPMRYQNPHHEIQCSPTIQPRRSGAVLCGLASLLWRQAKTSELVTSEDESWHAGDNGLRGFTGSRSDEKGSTYKLGFGRRQLAHVPDLLDSGLSCFYLLAECGIAMSGSSRIVAKHITPDAALLWMSRA